MKGLEIIECIAVEQVPNWVLICVLLGVLSILIPTFIVYKITEDIEKGFRAEIASGLIYLAFAIIFLASGVCEKPTGEYQYKVKITEDVGYVEFNDKYDVIAENDDGTYIIQKKND